MAVELSGQREQAIRDFRLLCPIGQHLVLSAMANLCEPLRSLRAGNQDDVRDVAWSEASADRQMDPLQQASVFPLLFQPFRRNFGVPFVRLTAATTIADADLSQHRALGGDRCLGLGFHQYT